jgi:hypothetical protein
LREAVPELREVVPELREGVRELREVIPELREVVPELREAVPEFREAVPGFRELVPEFQVSRLATTVVFFATPARPGRRVNVHVGWSGGTRQGSSYVEKNECQ